MKFTSETGRAAGSKPKKHKLSAERRSAIARANQRHQRRCVREDGTLSPEQAGMVEKSGRCQYNPEVIARGPAVGNGIYSHGVKQVHPLVEDELNPKPKPKVSLSKAPWE